ncbi:hypothetical protein GCM10027399_19310 [Curvibacter fontanus]
MDSTVVLYCKSYRTDLKRTCRLAKSIDDFNTEKIPFYISIPQKDFALFKEHLSGLDVNLIEDESIIRANPRIDAQKLAQLPGGQSQQIIKSEFWRLDISDSYVCLDSDSFFIRPFTKREFLSTDGTPYTIINEGHDILDLSLRTGKTGVIDDFFRESESFKKIFERNGPSYSYGPNPLIWHKAVWQSLEKNFLDTRGISFLEATLMNALDANWYGEALLKYKAIPIIPRESLFKVYHYAWQLDIDSRNRITPNELAKLYCGVIYQSAWDRQMDWPREAGSLGSRLSRRVKRLFGRI